MPAQATRNTSAMMPRIRPSLLRRLGGGVVDVRQVLLLGHDQIDVLAQQVVLERPHRVAVVGQQGNADVGVVPRHVRPHNRDGG